MSVTSGLEAPTRRRRATVPIIAGVFVVLAAASDVDFRWRDAQLALQGDADLQIRVELACWAAAACFVAWRMLHDRTWLVRRFPRDMGRSTQAFLLIAGVAVVSTVRLGSPLSVVRALQLLILVGLVAAAHRAMPDSAAAVRWWVVWRRMFVAAVALLVVASMALPALRFDVVTHTGYSRLTLFYTHPITTGAFLGLAAVLLTGSLLTLRDPWLRRPVAVAAAAGGAGALMLLVLATRARGPLLATAVALGVLVVLSRDRQRRAAAVLGAGILAAAAIWGAFDEQLYAAVVRGQSQSELLTMTGRTELFRYAGTLIAEQPIFGHGYLAARSLFLERFPWAGESHNAFVDLAISLGVLGFVLYAVLCARVVRRLRSGTAHRDHRRDLAAEGWALLSFLLIMGVVGESFAGAVGVEVITLAALVLIADTLPVLPRPAPRGGDARR